jgi:hypothetical protein
MKLTLQIHKDQEKLLRFIYVSIITFYSLGVEKSIKDDKKHAIHDDNHPWPTALHNTQHN